MKRDDVAKYREQKLEFAASANTLIDPERVLLEEIADPALKREDIALTYSLAFRSPRQVNWAKVNRAIMKRWSVSALEWIKKRAWDLTREANA